MGEWTVLPYAPSSVICSANATFPPAGGRPRAAEGGGAPTGHRRDGQGAHIGAPLHGGGGPIVVSPLGGLGKHPHQKPPSDEGGGICEANDGGRDRVHHVRPLAARGGSRKHVNIL